MRAVRECMLMLCSSLSPLLQSERVRQVSMAWCVNKFGWAGTGITYLKIDVEGSEEAVVMGVPVSLWPRVQCVVVEAHASGGGAERIHTHLRECGMFPHVVTEPDEELCALGLDNHYVYAWR